jgi:hypothetical protein
MSEMKTIFLLAEARADAEMVTCVADRILLEYAPTEQAKEAGRMSSWLREKREWRGVAPETTFTEWKGIKLMAQQHRIRVLGGGGMDRDMFRKAILVAEAVREDQPRWMVVSRDLDTSHPEERQASLEQISAEYRKKGWLIILALARPFREAWVLHGFQPQDEKEIALLKAERTKLGFDPTLFPERLTAQKDSAKQNAKRVLKALLSSSRSLRDREANCLEETPLVELRNKAAKSEGSGLKHFIESFENQLVPLLLQEG